MIKTKTFWLKAEKAAPFVVLVVLGLAALNILLSGLLIGLFFIKLGTHQIASSSPNPPPLSVKRPLVNQKLTGQETAILAYPEGDGFSKVEFSVDGNLEEELTPPNPYQVTFFFDTVKFSDGDHILSFKTTNSQGLIQNANVKVIFANHQKTGASRY